MPAGKRWTLGREELEICDWSRCSRCEATGRRSLPISVLREAPVVRRLRDVLLEFTWPVDRLTDHQVVDHISRLLAGGRLHVCRKPREKREYAGGAAQEAESVAAVYSPAPRRQAFSAPGARLEDAPTLSGSLDGPAPARVLHEAAEFGVPFCEECQRAFAAARGGAN
jgi:hypothetical protein